MEALTAAEMREADRHCLEDLGMPGPVLMENAGLRCVELLDLKLRQVGGKRIVVCAGKGNNGGDGFAIARHLALAGARVRVFLTAATDELEGDAHLNFAALLAVGVRPEPAVTGPQRRNLTTALSAADVAVDALLGTGLTGAPRDPAASVIRAINRSGCRVLAVDLPSGSNADNGQVPGDAVHADWTVTFARPKVGLLLHPAAEYCGELFVGSLGVPESAFARREPCAAVLTAESVGAALPPPRLPDTHKGTYGRVFVVGGSTGMSGAVVLACRGALRAGAGLTTAVVPRGINASVEAALIEATSVPTDECASGSFSVSAVPEILSAVSGADAVALGPGLSRHEEAAEVAALLLEELACPVVLDADGLTAFGGRLDRLARSRAPRVLTPHPGEAAALLCWTVAEVQRDRRAAVERLTAETGSAVVLKGSRTLVALPTGELRVNVTGNPGMATGGSGDVLTGLIAALLAQRLPPLEAACAGVFLHGLAGDLAARSRGEQSVVAGDLVDALPDAFGCLPDVDRSQHLTPRLRRLAPLEVGAWSTGSGCGTMRDHR